MTQHDSKNHHHGHGHEHGHDHGHGHRRKRPIHKHWATWVVVGLVLAVMSMMMYVLSFDESLQPGGVVEEPVPAAAE